MPTIDINEIKTILPHRYPFLLVDRVVEIEEERIVGLKCVTTNEPFFQGHFPDFPVMPGVLIVEAMAQTAGILVLRESGRPGTEFSVLAASGCYRRYHSLDAPEGLDPDLQLIIHGAFQRRHHEFQPARSVLYMQTGSGREVVVLLDVVLVGNVVVVVIDVTKPPMR